MSEFITLFNLGMKKRIKDSFLIGYGVIVPLVLIGILGYMATNYYSGNMGVTSYYYYSIVTIPFCAFLGAITYIYTAKEESIHKCGERFIIAPISKSAIILSKIIPATIVSTLYNILLLIICKFVFKVDFKDNMIAILLVLSVLGFLAASLGTFIGLCSKSFMSVKNIVSTPILIMALLGGSFFPIGSLGKVVETISYISPLTWINKGIFMMLNDNTKNIYLLSIAILMPIGLLFTVFSIKAFKKEAFIK
ncbi:MAG: ABC transporter permease [Sarcina sp.]